MVPSRNTKSGAIGSLLSKLFRGAESDRKDVSRRPASRAQTSRGRRPRRSGIETLEVRALLATITWDGGAGTFNWTDANNWDTNTLPTAADDAVIPDLTGTPTITISNAVTVKTITAAERIAITSGTVTVGNSAGDSSTFGLGVALSNGTLTGRGTVTAQGSNSWTGGQLGTSGQSLIFINANGATMSIAGSLTLGGVLNNLGTVSHGGSGSISGVNSATINNSGSYDLAMTINTTAISSGVTFNNTGTITQTVVGRTTSISGTFNNQGGTIAATAGTLTILASGTNTGGTFNASSGALVNLSTSATYSGTYTGSGTGSVQLANTLTVGGGGATFNFPSGLFTWTTPDLASGNLVVNGFVTSVNAMTIGSTLPGVSATLTVDGSISGLTGVTIRSGSQILVNATGTITGTGSVTVQSQATVSVDGSLSFNGAPGVSVADGGLLTGRGTVTGSVLNRGNVNPGRVGSAGVLTITGNYTQDTQSPLTIEIGGTTPGTEYDRLIIGGTLNLNPTPLYPILNERLINGFTPGVGQSFQILTHAGARTGDFAVYSLQGAAGIYMSPAYNAGSPNDLTLTAAATVTNTLIGTTSLGVSPFDIWHNSANWSLGVVPGQSHDVVIPDLPGTPTITYSAFGNPNNYVVHSITADELVSINSLGNRLNFTMTYDSVFNAGLNETGSTNTLISTTTTTFGGTSNWNGLFVEGSFTNTGTLTFSGSSVFGLYSGSLTNAGTLNITSTNQFQLHDFTINNQLGSAVTVSPGADLQIQPAAGTNAFYNFGSITDSTATAAAIGVPFHNSGTLTVSAGSISLTGGGSSTGTFAATSGNISFAGNAIHTLNAGAQLTSAGGNAVRVNASTTTVNIAGIVSSQKLDVILGTLNVNASLSVGGGLSQSGGTMNVSANLTVAGGMSMTGGTSTFTAPSTIAGGLTLSSGTLTVTGVTVSVSGNSSFTGGTIAGTGTLRNTGTLALTGTVPTITGNLSNAGTVNHSTTTAVTIGGSFTNEAGANYNITAASGGLNAFATPTGIVNLGTITRSAGAGTFNFNSSIVGTPTVQNSGVVNIQTGSATWQGAENVVHAGSFNLSSGTTLTFSNGVQTFGIGSQIAGGGTAIFNAGTMNFTGSTAFTAPMQVTGGTLNFSSINTYPSATMSSGTMSFTEDCTFTAVVLSGGALTISPGKSLTLTGASSAWNSGGSINGGGTLVVDSAATFVMNPNGAGLGLASIFSNLGTVNVTTAGAINMSGAGAIFNSGLFDIQSPAATLTNAGTFSNNSAGILRKSSNSGTVTLGAINNSGTIDVQAGTLNFNQGGVWTGGTYSAAAGTILQTTLIGGGWNWSGTMTGSGAGSMKHIGGNLVIGGSGVTWNFDPGFFTYNASTTVSGQPIVIPSQKGVTFNPNAGTTTVSASLNVVGEVTTAGTGTLTASGTLNNTGSISVSSGITVNATGTVAQGTTSTLTGGTWSVGTGGTLTFPAGAPNITAIGGAASVSLSGTFAKLNNVSSNQGTLQLGRNFTTAGPFTNNGQLSVGGTQNLTVNGSYTQAAGQTVLGFNQSFPGTITSSGTIQITGGTLKGFGTLSGNVTNSATLSPGASPGAITISGNYVQDAAGVLNIEVGGTNEATPEFDRLLITGSATLNGTLNATLINGFMPDKSESFRIMTFTSHSGDFSTINLPQISSRAVLATDVQAISYDLLGNTLIVRNLNDSGSFSLRDRIAVANSDAGPDAILFGVSGTLSPLTPLPAMTQPTILDATSIPNYLDVPLLEIRGDSIVGASDGLVLASGASGSAIRGLIINRFAGNGITIQSGSNVIAASYIGTDATGTVAAANAGAGIRITSGAGNLIGGTTAAARNIISGNAGDGVQITGIGTDSNVLVGNYIGLNSAGTGRIANSLNGVLITNGASGNRIGTNGDGVNDAGERNVISGNASSPNANVNIIGVGTTGNVVAGNYIGTTADGMSVVTNNGRGIRIATGATGNRIGTDGSNDAFNASERNVVAGHSVIAIFVVGGANSNVVAGNYIGLNADGTAALGNGAEGINLDGVSSVRIGTNADGVADALEANVIAGSGSWGMLVSNGATGNTIAGNRIGTNPAGTAAMPNALGGLLMGANATFNTIGGTVEGAGNLISGNTGPGIAILRTYLGVTYPASPNNTVAGNLIGTDVTGTLALGNSDSGIRVEEPNTTIGGTTAAARNVISGNLGSGIVVAGSSVSITGNYIGTSLTGNTALPNLSAGIAVLNGVNNTILGGFTSIAGTGGGNVISGNSTGGILLGNGSGTRIRGNVIGLGADGSTVLSNGVNGAGIFGSGVGTVIGGDDDDDGALDGVVQSRNVISGHVLDIWVEGNFTDVNLKVQGNYIGTDRTGMFARPNPIGNHAGVSIAYVSGVSIGGVTPGAGNVISGHRLSQLSFFNAGGLSANAVQGNIIGLAADGVTDITDAFHESIILYGGTTNTLIGGTTAAARNVIGGHSGIRISDAGTSNNTVSGNYIGTDISGTLVRSGNTGVLIDGGATNNTIGGTTPGARNVISGNSADGIRIEGNGTTGNVVAGNYIGTNANGEGIIPDLVARYRAEGGYGVDDTAGSSYGRMMNGARYTTGYLGYGFEFDGIDDYAEIGSSASLNPGAAITLSAWINPTNVATGEIVTKYDSAVGQISYFLDLSGGTLVFGVFANASASRVIQTTAAVISPNVWSHVTASFDAATQAMKVYVNGIEVGTTLISGATVNTIADTNAPVLIGSIVNAAGQHVNPFAGRIDEVSIYRRAITANEARLVYDANVAGQVNPWGNGNGVRVLGGASNNVIGGMPIGARNVITGNSLHGVYLEYAGVGTSSNVVQGNYIGTDANGLLDAGNFTGLRIDSHGNSVSGNLVSGNDNIGVLIGGNNNTLVGNLIGTNAAGNAAVGNLNAGVQISGSGNTVGGANAAQRNVISGSSSQAGNYLYGVGLVLYDGGFQTTANNVIQGNFIGTDATGQYSLGSSQAGITIVTGFAGSTGNLIGGSLAGQGNVISGNATGVEKLGGIFLNDAHDVTIQGNLIGTNASGTAALPNQAAGIFLYQSSGNQIGGTSTYSAGKLAGAGNLISGNTGGGIVLIGGSPNTGNLVQGNFIGTDITGTQRLSGSFQSFGVSSDGVSNTIGGTLPGQGNTISGQSGAGVIFRETYGRNNILVGNFIGTDHTGTNAIGNSTGVSIYLGSSGNVIGGTAAGARNVISGNTQYGIDLNGVGTGNVIQGNFVGIDASGTLALGNGLDGILNNSDGTTIGGSVAGAGNVISGNLRHGIQNVASNVLIAGNFIGTNASGTSAVLNGLHGIQSSGSNNLFGGFTPGHRNVIVAYAAGISLSGESNSRIVGNYIGTDITGTVALVNSSHAGANPVGIRMFGHPAASNITIGGGEPGAGNVINVGTQGYGIGVWIQHPGGSGNKVQGNFIGTDPTGSFRVGNNWGVLVDWQSGVVIGTDSDGSSDSTEGNVISGNDVGIMFGGFGGGISGMVIAGNLIGTDATGTRIIGNTTDGMQLNSYGSTRVGTNNDGVNDENECNVIAGSGRAGIWFSGDNTLIAGNYIGTDRTGALALPNAYGIIAAAGSGHTIGGLTAASGNVIANSTVTGLRLEGTTASNGTILNNTYFGNLYLGIDAGPVGPTPNDGDGPGSDGILDAPVLTSAQFVGDMMILRGNVGAGRRVDLFVSTPTTIGASQGQRLLASFLEDSLADSNRTAGAFEFWILIPEGVTHGTPLTALAIGSTSEFSAVLFAGEAGSQLAPQITLSSSSVTLTSGGTIDVDGSFYDPDSTAWSATVNFGDGSGVQPLTLNADNTFRLQHRYTATGNYTVTVRITDNSFVSSTKLLNVVVQNEAPTATFNSFTITSPVNEGQLVTLRGQFEDTGGTHTARIEWGDGSVSTVPIAPGSREILATHTYLDDSNPSGTATPSDVYRVAVTITDDAGASNTTPVGLFLEEVRNVIPSNLVVNFSSTSVTEGQAVSLSGTFVDPGVLDVHKLRINWGDGTEAKVTLPVGARSFAGLTQLTHVYVNDPSVGPDEYVITVEVADDDQPESPASLSQTVTVANALPSALTATISPSVIFENGIVVLNGSFFDAGLFDSHIVTVNWGDGSSNTVLNLAAGVSTYSGLNHQYLNNRTGGSAYTVSISVADNDAPEQPTTITRLVNVQNVAPTVGPITLSTGGAAIREGDELTLTGSYFDVSPADRHTVRIYWGDGTNSLASVDSPTRTFAATHVYEDNGETAVIGNPIPITLGEPAVSRWRSSIRVVVTDEDGMSGESTVYQEVNNVAPTVMIEPGLANTDPNFISLVAVATDPGIRDTVTITWTASTVSGTLTQTGSGANILVNRSGASGALWKVTVNAVDDDGGLTVFTTALLVGTNGDDVGANRLIVTDSMFVQSQTSNLLAFALAGDDVIDATGVTNPAFSVVLVGGAGQDDLYGGAGDDVYYLADGNDSANVQRNGGPIPVFGGNDRYRLRPNSILTVIDTTGDNILDFGLADFGITFDLSLNSMMTLTMQDVAPVVGQAPLHMVATQGQFRELEGSRFGDKLTAASNTTVFGGAGDDMFFAVSGTTGLTFRGGADNDILQILGTNIGALTFGGDAGADLVLNMGQLASLTFLGGADDDLFINNGPTVTSLRLRGDTEILLAGAGSIGTLNFGGDDGADTFINLNTIGTLTFRGGADDDLFINNGPIVTSLRLRGDSEVLLSGTGSITTLNFNGDDGVDRLLNTGSITNLTFRGGADDDLFINNGPTVTSLRFRGDTDVLLAGAGSIVSLNFGGDDGADTFVNLSTIGTLTFGGGADDDILINSGPVVSTLRLRGDQDILLRGAASITTLNFNGDDGVDRTFNTGSITGLTFRGGADDDLLINNGPVVTSLRFRGDESILLAGVGSIGTLNFGGDGGADVLVNLGAVTTLTFRGGADDDLLMNLGPATTSLRFRGDDNILLAGMGSIDSLVFGGDQGADTLFNSASITSVRFTGGADNDLLINSASGVMTNLNFGGDVDSTDPFADDGADTLLNAGQVTRLFFRGGADNDLLQNTGSVLDTLHFSGDGGVDTLTNTGTVASLTFAGGADGDVLINSGTVTGVLRFGGDDSLLTDISGNISMIHFSGDFGADILVNLGTVGGLIFTGGADDDLLQNAGIVLGTLNFGGDSGVDTLVNTGTVFGSLTFGGGADGDLLINTGTVIGTLTFGGDQDLLVAPGGTVTLNFRGDGGADVLINRGTLGGLIFTGGADDDILQNTGTVLTTLNFFGDAGADLLINTGTAAALTFTGGADDDLLFNSGTVTTLTFFGGADDDVLINNGNGIASLVFHGGSDNDVLINNGSGIASLIFHGGADNDVLVSNGMQIGSLWFTGDDNIPVSGRTSNDTLIVRGSGSGDPASELRFDGGYGIDAFENNATGFGSVIFNGGLDDDVMLNNASGLSSLIFNGDEGADVLLNHGAKIASLTFTGGADKDILVNDGASILSLTFNGGADNDLLINSGHQIVSLTFNGGADDDIFVNQGNQIATLTFNGGADDDILINDGAVLGRLVFRGDGGNNELWNRKTGIDIGEIEFIGDDGVDKLINDAAGLGSLTFLGGADDDILQNNGSVNTLTFWGGADDDVFVNNGVVRTLTFHGGADNDILLNRGLDVVTLNFFGDAGVDTLFNLGNVTSLIFMGGADGDVLQNNGPVVSLNFSGDAGADLLINNGPVTTLIFTGGADNDILQNNATVGSLTFYGGADTDIFINNGNNITSLYFSGDAGVDTLINNGSSVASLTFFGGADGDTLRIQGRNIGNVLFDGGDGPDSFSYNATGSDTSVVTFNAMGGDDLFAMRGTAREVHFDGGLGNDSVMIVGSAAMFLTGGDGNDIYRFVNNPLADVTLLDVYTGTEDTSSDTLDFSSFSGGAVNLDLRLINIWQPQGNGQLRIWLTDGMAMENVIGSSFSDTIYGNARSNYLSGADFDEPFTGPVAAPRGVTQWVLLDFDTYTNTGILDPTTGVADVGEYVYSTGEREQIRQRVESIYRGPNVGAPWFDVRVVSSLNAIPEEFRASGRFATIYFNRTPDFGRPGGLASEIDPGNVNLGGYAVVQVNGLLGGIITSKDALDGHVEDDRSGAAFKGDQATISDVEVGATKPAATSENFVLLSSKIAAHELAHLLGLRHQDSFGPIGSGVHDPPGAAAYKPIYTGPSGGVETFDHIIGSPASVGSTRFDDLNDLFFGEREAIKLAFANSDPSATTRDEGFDPHRSLATAEVLTPVTLAVPNALSRGLNQSKDFFVQLGSITGRIDIDPNTGRSESDWYSFTGRKGELINIDVLSNSMARFGTGPNGQLLARDFVDTIVRVYDANGVLVPYYNGVAENDDMFEPTDSALIDLQLPADGTYYIEVDTFHRYGDPLGDASNPASPLNPANPNNLLAYPDLVARFRDTVNDTDTGRYQLIMYKFRKASSSDGVDDLKGFGGIDTIVGGPGDSFETSYGLGAAVTISEGTLFSRVLTVNDRAASNWTGTTVDYGDGNGPQTLTVSPVPGGGQFVLTHSWSNSGTYTIFVTLRNDLGRTIEQSLIVTVSNFIPIVTIHNAPTTSPEGTAISLTSTAGNAAGTYTPLTYAWTVTKNGLSYAVGNTSDFSFTPDDNGIYVVTLTVDGDGGVATDTKTITVTNVAPTVSISGAPATSPEGTAISLTSVASDVAGANDPLTFAWTVTKNGLPFASDNTPNFSFTPDDNGIYVVTLVVDDGDGGDTTTTQTIIVLNVAPAAALVGPTSASSNTAVSILSTVKDPAGAEDPLTYQWTVTRNGAAFATQSGGRIFEFTPTLFGAYVFTLVVDDGDGGVTTATHSLTVTSSSTNTAPTVTISGPATGVRGDSITYTFKATDPDAADQAGLFLWTINWGDGSPVQTLSGPAVISVKHIFTAAASSRTITATAKDAANNISAAASKAVQILVWELQPDPLQPGSFILVVGGSMRDDHIRIRDKSSRKNSYYELKFDNDDNDDDDDGQATGGDGQDKFKVRIYQDISGVIILAQAGNDKIDFDAEIDVWSIIDGGDGNDRIKGGGSANIILGGNGDDQLDGENGRDLLIGGRGSDSIKGGKGDDLIISGFTAFDDNREALLAIMKEWTRNTSFASRRDRLMGTTSGGLNGGYFLIPSGASRTVFDDNDVDELWGGDGNDWFLLNMNSAEQSRVDKIKDFRNGDEDDDINLF